MSMTSTERSAVHLGSRRDAAGVRCVVARAGRRPATSPRARRSALRWLSALLGLLVVLLAAPSEIRAFGEAGSFHPRVLLTGKAKFKGVRKSAPSRWSLEVIRRTSAPARVAPATVRADEPALLEEPFAVWAGAKAPAPLTRSEIGGLRRFFALGGVLLVDDQDPATKRFGKGAKRELRRVLPAGSPIAIGPENVVFRSYYLLRRAVGRVEGSGKLAGKLEAIVRGGAVQVIFSSYDILGALAQSAGAVHPLDVVPGGEAQRERAVRLAVNIAMYVLCSNYKDDQVHAPAIMRRRAREQP